MNELRQGNSSALENIYRETSKSVFSICYSMMRNYHTAEDMMQDTFLKISSNINFYKPNTNAKAWINTIAKNSCLNELKKRKREVFHDFEKYEKTDINSNIKIYDETGIISIVMKNLNENESQIILMHTIGDISLKEIARLKEKSAGTIRWQYNNALTKLRKIIEKEGLS